MKNFNLLFTILLLMTLQQGMAQLEKGNLLVGGTAGFDIQFDDGDNNPFTLLINPSFAKFVTDNVAVGGNLGLTYQKSGDFSTTFFSLLPSARYYIPGTGGSPTFFIEAKAGLVLLSVGFDGESSSDSAIQFAFGPGMAFFISDNVSIDAILAYNRIGGDFDQSNFGLNVGFQVFLAQGGE